MRPARTLLAVLALSASALAQPQPGQRPPAAPTEQPAKPAEPKKPDAWLVIKNATVHTVSGPVLSGVSVVCKNGRIHAIDPAPAIPEGAQVLDATDLHLYPGLVSVRSQGVLGAGNPEDTSDVFGLNVTAVLAAGITTTLTDNTAAKLTLGSLEGMIVKRNVFESLTYSSRNPAGKKALRESFDKLRAHLRDVEDHEEKKKRDPSAKAPDASWIRGEAERNLRLLKGEAVAIVDANTAHEILEVCELASTYRLRIVLRGAHEAWTVPTALARANAAAIVTPRLRVDADEDLLRPNGATIQSAAILNQHGVTVSFIPVGGLFGPGTGVSFGGLGGRDQLHLNMEAAFAVRGGLSNEDALRAITLDAARILGIDHRVGSIEVGKDADFAVTYGDILHYTTLVRWTIVNGKIAYDHEKESLYAHIRPGGDASKQTPPLDHWPRRLRDPIPELPGRPAKPQAHGSETLKTSPLPPDEPDKSAPAPSAPPPPPPPPPPPGG